MITFEDRIAPAGILPTPIASGGLQIPGLTRLTDPNVDFLEGAGAAHPLASNQFVAVGSRLEQGKSNLAISFQNLATGGGSSLTVSQIFDPVASATALTKYTQSYMASLAYGTDGKVHIVSIQSSDDKSSGALVYNEYFWPVGGAPIAVPGATNRVLRQWAGSTDPVFNPFVAVNANVAAFTDPVSGITNRDPLADPDNVYIFWNTNATATSQIGGGQSFNPNVIQYMASSDGGATFGAVRTVSDSIRGYVVTTVNKAADRTYGHTQPVAAFSPGNSATPGRLSVVWSGTQNGGLYLDNSTPGNAPAVSVQIDNNGFFGINDGFDPGGGNPHKSGVTTIPFPVNITDPTFSTLGDVDVKLALIHPNLSELQIRLVYDNNTPGDTTDDIGVTLVRARIDNAGATPPAPPAPALQLGLSGANLGGFTYQNTGFFGPGTIFDDSAARPIHDTTTAAPYVGTYRPEVGSLNATFGGRSAASIRGTWSIQISDTRATPATPPVVQFVSGASLSLTSAPSTTGVQTFKSTGSVAIADALPGDVPQATKSTIAVPAGGIADPYFNTLTNLVVTTNVQHPSNSEVQLRLIYDNNTPGDTSDDIAVLLAPTGALSGANVGPNAAFDQTAKNPITTFTAPYSNTFQPVGGSLAAFNGRTATNLEGNWSLEVTDSKTDAVAPTQSITDWSLRFVSSTAKTLFGTETKLSGRAVQGSPDGVNPLLMPSVPVRGVGPGVTIAYDNSLGSSNPTAGNFYIAFTGQQDKNTDNVGENTTDIFLLRQPNGGTFGAPFRINDDVKFNPTLGLDGKPGLDGKDGRDEPTGHFFEETRAQFMPTLAVDMATGTLGIAWRDARWDASNTRVSTFFTASNNGGQSFSEQVFLNEKHEAFNAITLDQVTFEPYPDNGTTMGPAELGTRISMYASAPGQFRAVWSGSAKTTNGDLTGASVRSATVQVAAGPRIISQSMGPVAVAGGINIDFDRPIENSTFTTADVTVIYRAPGEKITDPGTVVPLASVAPTGLTSFFIQFATPQTKVGTYSYSIGTNITDRVRLLSGATGNLIDQNADGKSGTTSDILTIDGRTIPSPFVGQINPNNGLPVSATVNLLTQPLIITGPRFLSISMPEQDVSKLSPDIVDALVLNRSASMFDLNFDRDMDGSSFTLGDIIRFTGPAGPIVATGVSQVGPRTLRVTFPAQSVSGHYAIDISSDITSTAGDKLDQNLNAGLDILRGGSPLSGPVVTQTYNSTSPAVTIPSFGTVSMPLTINDTFLLQQTADKRIQIRLNITNSFTPSLRGTLVAPDGQRITLFSGVGGPPGANFINTLLDDASGNIPIQIASNPFDTGPYNPQLPLSELLSNPNLRFNGTWRLEIQNFGGSSGTINSFSLTLPYADSTTGLGESVADRISTGFRVFIQDPLNPAARQQWTPVGPASSNETQNSSRLSAITRDPSDPTGNTFFAAGASGGVWKTTNFLTSDPNGPIWIPQTDFGPTSAINIGSIAVFPRNGDPNQTVVFALTGEGNTLSPGVGVLRSLDGGRTWKVLDSTHNADAAGNILPIDVRGPGLNQRDGVFLGATGFEIIVDPKLAPTGEIIVYMAVRGGANQAGLWRSIDSGRNWFRIRAGQAVDVVLAAGSASTTVGASGNLEILYAAFQGEGVFLASQAASATSLTLMAGGQGNPLLRDVSQDPSAEVTIGAPSATPNGAKGRIVLASPTFKENLLENQFYAGWLYALVVTPTGNHEGLYVTKDFGRNWTRIRLPLYNIPMGPLTGGGGWGSNDEARPDIDIFSQGAGSSLGAQGNYDIAISLDPYDPQIVYIAGLGLASTSNRPVRSSLRVDIRTLSDPGTFVFTDNTRSQDAALPPSKTTGPAVSRDETLSLFGDLLIPPNYLTPYGAEFTNLIRDPQNPFISNATLQATNTKSITNDGAGAKYTSFTDILATNGFTVDIHRITSFPDPITGRTRLVYIGDQGIMTGVDRGDGLLHADVGFSDVITANRNGNLQINQFYTGAVQPSQLAADLAGAFFYGMAQDNGFPVSARDIIRTGNLNWRGPTGDGNGVATDATGSGTAYQYRWPCCMGDNGLFQETDFFRVFLPTAPDPSQSGNVANESAAFSGGFSRTFGLLQAGDDPATDKGQWPLINAQVGKFAVNPIDAQGLVMGSNAGRLFRTTNQGKNWFSIGEPNQLDGTLVQAPAFGAPDPFVPGELNNFIYAGTAGGKIFVTNTGQAPWRNISAGLDGSAVQVISANTRPGSTDAFAVTLQGVYHMRDSKAASPVWENITGNLFELNRTVFGELTSKVTPLSGLQYLVALAADWRFDIPETPGDPDSATFPVLYVGGQGGVFRSLDRGDNWTYFPDIATDGAAVDGGYLSNALVTDLDLSFGDLDPATGKPKQAGGYNLLLATTYGRGSFAIRIDPNLDVEGGLFQSGPQITSIGNPSPLGGPTNSLRVFFNSPVEEITFDANDVKLFDTTGAPVSIASVTRVQVPTPYDPDAKNRFDTYDITFTGQTIEGFYRLQIGPDLTDLAGNRMNQNNNTTNGEGDDAFDRWVWLNSTNGSTLTLTALPPTVVAGSTNAVTAQVFQRSGQLNTGYTGTVTFSSTDGQAGLPVAYTFVAGDQGTKSFTVTLKTAGDQSVILTGTAGPAVDPAKVTTTVIAGPAKTFLVTGLPASVTAGTVSNLTVTAKDEFDNFATYNGTVTFTSTDGKATLPADSPLVGGTGTFPVTLVTAGTQSVTAADTVDPTLSGTATTLVVAAAAVRFDVTGPTSSVAGTSVSFTVIARDLFDNVADGYTGTVAFTISDPLATPIAPSVLVNGQGTFSTTFFTAATHTITATDTVTSSITGLASIVVVPAAASTFFLTVPPAAVAGTAFSATVTAKDAFGNLATGYTGIVRITTTDPQGTTPANAKLTNGAGTFTGITLRTAGDQTVTAADTVDAALTVSSVVTVSAAAASSLIVTSLPATVTASLPAGFTVTAKDAFGNVAVAFNGTVSFKISDPLGTVPVPYTFVPATDKGTKTFQATFNTPGTATLTATTAGPVTPGTATTQVLSLGRFDIQGVANPATAGLAYTVIVTARDTAGNVVTGYTGTATVALSDANGTSPTTITFTAADQGVVSFPVIYRTLGSQTLTVAPNAGVLDTGSITTTVVNAGRIAFTLPSQVTAGVPITVTVRAEDYNGATLVGYQGTVAFTSSDGAAVLPANYTFTSADNGQRDFTFTLKTAGAASITATPELLDAATANTLVRAAAATSFNLTNIPSPATTNQAFTFTVTAFDPFGNLADGYNQPVRVTTTDPRATLPSNAPLTNGVGSFTITLRTAGTQTLTAADAATGTPTASTPVTVTNPPPPPPAPAIPFAVGAGPGLYFALVFNPDGTQKASYVPFGVGSEFAVGVRVASADFNGDGKTDYAFGTGPGVPTEVRVIDGNTGGLLFATNPFESKFLGGVYVAAGDMNGDGKAELVITPDEGGGPRVRVFTGDGFTQLADFFGIDDPNFRGGARPAVGDLNGDGKRDLIVAAGFGGGPRVAAFDGALLQSKGGPKLFNDFFVFEQSLRNGVFVAAGDLTGDGVAELIVGGGPGGGPRVLALDGADLIIPSGSVQTPVANFFAGPSTSRSGVRVAVGRLNTDGIADLITGSGDGSRVRGYLGDTLVSGSLTPVLDFDAFDPSFSGGVFVG